MERLVFVDYPYISEFFKKTICQYGLQVVKTAVARELCSAEGDHLLEEEEAIRMADGTG